MLPVLELLGADVEGRTRDLAQEHVALSDSELAARIAHRGTAVAAAPRLVEQKRAVLRLEPMQYFLRRVGNRAQTRWGELLSRKRLDVVPATRARHASADPGRGSSNSAM